MGRCRRHPQHSIVGVCAHCLNDRLLALMEEEEDEELMVHELSGCMSPHAYHTYMPPPASSCVHANSNFSKHRSGSGIGSVATPIHASRASADYNRTLHAKQMSASFLNKQYHHSLSSSPLLHSCNAPTYIRPSQRPAGAPFDAHPPFIAEEITTRKKRPSLWSFFVRPRDDGIASKRQNFNAYVGEHVRLQRDEFTGIVKVHRIAGARGAEEASWAMKQKSENVWKVDGNVSDGFARSAGKPSLSSSRREALDNLSKNDAASLLSSPKFMASPSRQACSHGLYPSPISKYTPPSPLNNESTRYRDSQRASPARQVPVSYGLSGHVENFGASEYIVQDDDDTSRPSWISSLFPRRHQRAKSISGGSNAASFSQASHLHSAGASPESGPRGRRKSVSFLDDHLHDSPSRYIVSKLSQGNGVGIGFRTPDVQQLHTYKGTKSSGTDQFKARKQPLKSPKGSMHGALREHSDGQKHSHSHGDGVNEQQVAAGLSASPTISKADSTSSKSPRAKLANFLNKRKNGTMSIDCGRDVRVSPVPMLRVKKDYCNDHDFLDNSDHDHPGGSQGLEGLRRHLEHHDDGVSHRYAEHLVMDSRFKEELQKSSMAVDQKEEILNSPTPTATAKDTSKSPRLMSLQAMKQLLKSPRLAPVRTTKRESEDEEGQPYSRSWSKAFSKTLSPMLGRKPKKKPSFRKQEFVHYAYAHSQHGYNERPQQSDEDRGSNRLSRPNVQYGTYHNGNYPPVRKHHLQHQHGNRSCNGRDELLVHETRVLPAHADEKGPPQQYSFLSKDYSAFSFYFSPRRSGSIDSATRSSKKSVW